MAMCVRERFVDMLVSMRFRTLATLMAMPMVFIVMM
jgi:hypothetical protein